MIKSTAEKNDIWIDHTESWAHAKGLIPESWHPTRNLLDLNLESDIWFIDFSETNPSGERFAGGDYLEWVGLFSPDSVWLSY